MYQYDEGKYDVNLLYHTIHFLGLVDLHRKISVYIDTPTTALPFTVYILLAVEIKPHNTNISKTYTESLYLFGGRRGCMALL